METLATKIQNDINAHVAKMRERYLKRQKAIEEAFKECNENIAPTLGAGGRFHAPVDGYMLPDANRVDYSDDYSDRVFAKGQYLPIPISDEDRFFNGTEKPSFQFSSRIKLAGDDLEAVKSMTLEGVELSAGKSWKDALTKLDTAYIYVKAFSKGLLNIVVDAIKAHHKEVEERSKEDLKALKGIAPTGKQTVTGTVLKWSCEDGFAYGTYIYKMTVKLENGATVHGSIPTKIVAYVEKGETVTFSANFEHAKDDNTHAFYKRPTKPVITYTLPKGFTEIVYDRYDKMYYMKVVDDVVTLKPLAEEKEPPAKMALTLSTDNEGYYSIQAKEEGFEPYTFKLFKLDMKYFEYTKEGDN